MSIADCTRDQPLAALAAQAVGFTPAFERGEGKERHDKYKRSAGLHVALDLRGELRGASLGAGAGVSRGKEGISKDQEDQVEECEPESRL